MSLDNKIRKAINTKMGDIAKILELEAERMKKILETEVAEVKRLRDGNDFLNYIDVDSIVTINSNTLSIGISFNKDMVSRKSISKKYAGETAYLPRLFDQGYEANGVVYNDTGNMYYDVSWPYRKGLFFMKRAINKFNSTSKYGFKAVLNDKIYNKQEGDLS